jgi:hypothetical protein
MGLRLVVDANATYQDLGGEAVRAVELIPLSGVY